jgi:RES domain
MLVTAFRSSNFVTPVRDSPSTRDGRFHGPGSPPTQYFCLHPLGPSAEIIRWGALTDPREVRDLRLRIWAMRVEVPDDLLELGYANCTAEAGLSPDELVGDAYGPTQAAAARLLARGQEAFTCPSAALPGTRNLVVFGERVSISYDYDPVDEWEIPASMTTSRGAPPVSLFSLVRRLGESHAELDAVLSGSDFRFQEPSWRREAP